MKGVFLHPSVHNVMRVPESLVWSINGLKNGKNLTKLKKLTSEMASVSRTQPYMWLINESFLVAPVARAVIIYASQGRVFSL